MEAMGPTHVVAGRLSWTAILNRYLQRGEEDRAERAVVVHEAENDVLAYKSGMQ
jgi:hypothetical protein